MTKETKLPPDQAAAAAAAISSRYGYFGSSLKQALNNRFPVLTNANSVVSRTTIRGGGGGGGASGSSPTGLLANIMSRSPTNNDTDDDNDDDDDNDNNTKKASSNRRTTCLPKHKKVLSLPLLAAASPSLTTKSSLHLLLAITCTLYILNQSHLLPRALSGIVSKVLFWPTLPLTFGKRFGKWSTVVDDTVSIGGVPFWTFPERLYEDHGVRGVINMCEEYAGPVTTYKRLGIEQLHLPTVDHVEPSFEDMQAAVKFIADYEAQNKGRVYVHCKAGHGRSAAIVYAWLLSKSPDLTVADMKELNEQLCEQRDVRKTLWKQPNINEFRSWLHLGRERTGK